MRIDRHWANFLPEAGRPLQRMAEEIDKSVRECTELERALAHEQAVLEEKEERLLVLVHKHYTNKEIQAAKQAARTATRPWPEEISHLQEDDDPSRPF
jgi:hypothetical protein